VGRKEEDVEGCPSIRLHPLEVSPGMIVDEARQESGHHFVLGRRFSYHVMVPTAICAIGANRQLSAESTPSQAMMFLSACCCSSWLDSRSAQFSCQFSLFLPYKTIYKHGYM